MRDVKYLAAYLVPASAAFGLYEQGLWSWLTLALVFGILPVVELFSPQSTENVPPLAEEKRSKRLFFDLLLYLNAPIVYALTLWYLWLVANGALSGAEWLGLTISVGIVAGANGINVAHELGHRTSKFEQWLAQIMLLPSLYQHFFVEHNRGHHKNVATDADPASARRGESLYAFWFRSVVGGWRSGWAIERERLLKKGASAGSWQNALLRYAVFQSAWLAAIAMLLGGKALVGALGVAVVSFLLLETVNYIEHYGLRRRILANGYPEPVLPRHSWNSNHALGRIFLYELTRHSDHHYKATRKYQILRHMDDSPQLPFGYPTSIVLALVPPVWFWMMHKRLPGALQEAPSF
jgi:alkane 1-monooxygenase